MTTLQSTMLSQRSGDARVQSAEAHAAEAQALGEQATQDALWRIAQNNAMAKLRGYNTLAKSANDMA
ncbi:hypothetical protein ACFOHT_05735 [Massilia oculi]|jgi:hypothetical protein|uniref:Uncharacterized protein n=1 Tax=Massilia oculi TaxID=945844 RepID=A0A2S2DDX2_9BURK|nr:MULTISPECIES: hypothetical protein [Massilia]AWL03542.1 hypothetical protein DIR46_03150 [Massilia oculi]MDY0977302.1 hypothetical protein [Massilia sp. CFBP9012]